MSNIEFSIIPDLQDLGNNFVIRRSLPHRKKRMVGPFIFWDHMGPVKFKKNKGMIVHSHPHIGLATITWLFKGEILHRDSLNNEQLIIPGEVNWMTAGKGIVHSERAQALKDGQELEGIQLWLALPKEYEDIDPSFFHCKSKELKKISFGDLSATLIAGSFLGHKSPVPVYSDLFYLDASAEEGNQCLIPLKENHEGAIYIVEGEAEVGGETFQRYSLISFKKGSEISFKALSNCRLMIFGGEVFPEKRFIWWNFVSTSKDKIEEAKKRWENEEFSPVINETERIPHPDEN